MKLPSKGLVLSIAAAFALIACGKKEAPPPQAAATPSSPPPLVVKIGHAAPLTGPQAHLGKDNENGARLAIEDVNATHPKIGGRDVVFELMAEDDQADPRQGTLVAQQFVDAKVDGVIGHLNSGTTIPASRIYADAGLPQISPSATNPQYTEQGFKTAFRVMANDRQQGKVLGEYAANQLHARKMAIIDDKTAYGEGLANEFKKAAVAAGVNIVAEEHTDDKAVDFAAILTRVKSKKPDLIFYGGMDTQAGPMAAQMKKLGIHTKLLMGDGGCTTEFPKLAGAAAEGHYCSLPGVPLEKMNGGIAFTDRYKARFHTDIQLYAPYAYDATMVMIDAMKRANSVEPAKYLAALRNTAYEGLTSKISFDEQGDIKNGEVTLYQFRGGKKVPLETIGGPPAGEAQPGEKM